MPKKEEKRYRGVWIYKNGKRVELSEEEIVARKVKHIPYANGLRSFSGGAATRAEARQFNRELMALGISDRRYDEQSGDAIYDNRKARNAELKRRGLMDKDGGYGDYTNIRKE